MDDLQRGYLAGVIEGEGWLHLAKERNYERTGFLYPNLGVESTDEDVVRRLREITGVGRINKRTKQRGNKPSWTWKLSRPVEVVPVLEAVYPLVSKRRQIKIQNALKCYDVRGLIWQNFCRFDWMMNL